MRLTVAGITMEVVGDDPSLRLSLPGPVRRFVVADAEPEVTVRVGLGELRQECDAEPTFGLGRDLAPVPPASSSTPMSA